jgi:phage shock protein E
MRRLFALIAILLGTTALLAGCSSSGGSVQDVSPDQFMTAAAQSGTVVVDVRTPGEYASGHVDGAVNIDVESAGFATQIATLPKDATYAVYCHSGRRSKLATDQMAEAGFTSLKNLQGGIADLQAAGAPIVTG